MIIAAPAPVAQAFVADNSEGKTPWNHPTDCPNGSKDSEIYVNKWLLNRRHDRVPL
jgi:hypothetical protein